MQLQKSLLNMRIETLMQAEMEKILRGHIQNIQAWTAASL